MAWYDEAVFYHIYPLGMTGAPKENTYGEVEHRLNTLIPWISHIKNIENLKIDNCTKQDTIGFETYCSKYEDSNGKSEIIFTIDKID